MCPTCQKLREIEGRRPKRTDGETGQASRTPRRFPQPGPPENLEPGASADKMAKTARAIPNASIPGMTQEAQRQF